MATPAGAPTCEACGRLLEQQQGRGRRRRFCDAKCRSLGRRLRDAQRADDPAQRPFARAVNAAIEGSGRSLRVLSKDLDLAGYYVSPSTLSQWRSGNTRPHATEDIQHRLFALERLADIPTGDLLRALLASGVRPVERRMPRHRPSARTSSSRRLTLDEARQRVLQRITELDGSDTSALLQVQQQEHYVVGPLRHPVRSDITLTVRALRGGLDRYWHVFAYDPVAPMTLEAGDGCTKQVVLDDLPPVRLEQRRELQVVAVRLRFEAAVPVEGEYRFSFTMRYPAESTSPIEVAVGPIPPPVFQRVVTSPATRRVELRISFDEDRRSRPRRLWRARWALQPAGGPPVERTPVPIDQQGRGEPLILTEPAPGGYGFVWDWSRDDEGLP